jgi:hypothetical protein
MSLPHLMPAAIQVLGCAAPDTSTEIASSYSTQVVKSDHFYGKTGYFPERIKSIYKGSQGYWINTTRTAEVSWGNDETGNKCVFSEGRKYTVTMPNLTSIIAAGRVNLYDTTVYPSLFWNQLTQMPLGYGHVSAVFNVWVAYLLPNDKLRFALCVATNTDTGYPNESDKIVKLNEFEVTQPGSFIDAHFDDVALDYCIVKYRVLETDPDNPAGSVYVLKYYKYTFNKARHITGDGVFEFSSTLLYSNYGKIFGDLIANGTLTGTYDLDTNFNPPKQTWEYNHSYTATPVTSPGGRKAFISTNHLHDGKLYGVLSEIVSFSGSGSGSTHTTGTNYVDITTDTTSSDTRSVSGSIAIKPYYIDVLSGQLTVGPALYTISITASGNRSGTEHTTTDDFQQSSESASGTFTSDGDGLSVIGQYKDEIIVIKQIRTYDANNHPNNTQWGSSGVSHSTANGNWTAHWPAENTGLKTYSGSVTTSYQERIKTVAFVKVNNVYQQVVLSDYDVTTNSTITSGVNIATDFAGTFNFTSYIPSGNSNFSVSTTASLYHFEMADNMSTASPRCLLNCSTGDLFIMSVAELDNRGQGTTITKTYVFDLLANDGPALAYTINKAITTNNTLLSSPAVYEHKYPIPPVSRWLPFTTEWQAHSKYVAFSSISKLQFDWHILMTTPTTYLNRPDISDIAIKSRRFTYLIAKRINADNQLTYWQPIFTESGKTGSTEPDWETVYNAGGSFIEAIESAMPDFFSWIYVDPRIRQRDHTSF